MTLEIVIFGLSITSSWGNGHAVTYRSLIKALAARGHHVTFLERDMPWYRASRDLSQSDCCRIELYNDLREIPARFGALVASADLVILGSFVPQGAIIGDWITSHADGVTAFYDIDTPATLAALETGGLEYLTPSLIPRFDLYLSFTGGPTLNLIEERYGSPQAQPLYCTADVEMHAPLDQPKSWAMGYLGTYSKDRQPALEELLIAPARQLSDTQFVVAGAQYPVQMRWPSNVVQIEHCPPAEHAAFYSRQRYALNLTRADMVAAGYSPSVRLFEAAACEVPVISDRWTGLDVFFTPGKEILTAGSCDEALHILREIPEERRRELAASARKRFLRSHTPAHRAKQVEEYYAEAIDRRPARMLAETVV
jgi:spore maturation protein CgeB